MRFRSGVERQRWIGWMRTEIGRGSDALLLLLHCVERVILVIVG